ncbi:hypothetical protein MYX06_00090 [Patescibacteria group bacterium AH-259-L05]|nr:hypothetical protein [Patescibacteria group bacterium AH-259-L05]
MKQETKQCQNCKQQFMIEPDDFDFYKKVKVPAPTFCPQCRLQRRLAFFNLINLYKRPCDLCKEEKVSMYAPDAPYTVYCPHCWWSDNWDPYEYGRDYDFSRPFFEQFNDLWHEVPLLGLSLDLPTTLASPHNNHAGHLKNCYLIFHADCSEDSAYGMVNFYNKSVFDCSLIRLSELCYDCIHVFKNSRGIGLNHVVESLDCAFLRDCINCQDCFACANLRNKKYHIFNKPYTKEAYFKTIKQWDLGSYKTYQEIKQLAKEHWKKFPPKPRWDELSVNVTGNYVFESKNCKQCYEVDGAQDCKYLFMMSDPPIKDCYDISSWGNNQTLSYECNVVGENVSNVKFCQEAGLTLYNAEYSKLSTGGSNHFGCVSAKKGQYCILNKRYSKEEFETLRKKIIQHMNDMPYTDKKGRVYKYGEFFPIELSPQFYNETVAQRFFPLSKQEIINKGYQWKDPEQHTYEITIKANDLPDHIKDVSDDMLQEVIECAQCRKGFKIIQMELGFLHKMNLPLPRSCPFCRINKKFNQWVKNLQIVTRTCSQCSSEFETSYSKERAKTILCKQCYLKQVV